MVLVAKVPAFAVPTATVCKQNVPERNKDEGRALNGSFVAGFVWRANAVITAVMTLYEKTTTPGWK